MLNHTTGPKADYLKNEALKTQQEKKLIKKWAKNLDTSPRGDTDQRNI